MKQVNTRGIHQATKHVLMAALCHNLKKNMGFHTKKVSSAAVALTYFKKESLTYLNSGISEVIGGFLCGLNFPQIFRGTKSSMVISASN